MRTKQSYYFLPAFLLLVLSLVTGCDRENPLTVAPSAGSFTITSQEQPDGPTSMKGTFKAYGSIDDHGSVRDSLDNTGPLDERGNIHGKKILVGQKGMITIEFYVALYRVDGITLRANGGFRVIEGTGAYAELQGTGEIDMLVLPNASPSAITRVLEGVAEYSAS